jgi:exosortase A-associated hydrolase 1
LLIISGGNEIRSGTFAGQADIARHMQALGYPVFRFDRRGVGDSEGINRGFENSAEDILAALSAFRKGAPHMRNIVGLGNCDAATALALFPKQEEFCALILSNPWTIDPAPTINSAPATNAAAIRARYWTRLKSPRTIFDLLAGRISIRKLATGLARATAQNPCSTLATRLNSVLGSLGKPIMICLAERDTTAIAFRSVWKSKAFKTTRAKANISLSSYATASHSFAEPPARAWLYEQVERVLKQQG